MFGHEKISEDDADEDEDHEDTDNKGFIEKEFDDQIKMFVSRMLTAVASDEIARLKVAHKDNEQLMNALRRASASKKHQLTQLSRAHENLWPENKNVSSST